jgi:hypothetical protein
VPWQDNTQARLKLVELNFSNADVSYKVRMDTLERRLIEIEKRLLLEPPAA